MQVRNFQAGDEAIQVALYNVAAAALPNFKPASVADVRRRCQASDATPSPTRRSCAACATSARRSKARPPPTGAIS